jgi:exonuclease III
MLVMTLNINGSFSDKRFELQRLIASRHPDVVCLQETRRKSPGWRLKMHYAYASMEVAEVPGVEGSRGVAVAVHKSLTTSAMPGFQCDRWIFAKVGGRNLHDTIVASVYISSFETAATMKKLGLAVAKAARRYPDCPMVLMGDWNQKPDVVAKRLELWKVEARVAASGQPTRQVKGVSRNEIDFAVLVLPRREAEVTAAVVTSCDISDHYPVLVEVEAPDLAPAERPALGRKPKCDPRQTIRMSPEQVQVLGPAIQSHNRFDALLADLPEDDKDVDIHALAENFVGACSDVATVMGVMVNPERARVRLRAPKPLLKAIRKRAKIFQKLRQLQEDDPLRSEAEQEYKAQRKVVKRATRDWKQHEWVRYVEKGAGTDARLCPKRYWRWCQKLIQLQASQDPSRSVGSRALQMRDPETQLPVSDPERVSELWCKHYAALAADETGHSRISPENLEYWAKKGLAGGRDDVARPEMKTLGKPIDFQEVEAVLQSFRNGSAPGKDGIPAEFLKCACTIGDDDHALGLNVMGVTLHKLCQLIFHRKTIPNVWKQAMIVSIPKKGDLTDFNNHRGISLMAVALKIVTALVARRISQALESSDGLAREQAGFRPREEAIGQGVALYEVLARRSLKGNCTYAIFIDLKKAYDRVPHSALLRRMRQIGVPEDVLCLFRELYATSSFCVKGGFGVSDAASLDRGVRQGCSSSPVLFNIFINDILKGIPGVRVTGGHQVPGFMFADDLVVLASTRSALQQALDKIAAWCDHWEMSMGHAKCGIMVFGPEGKRQKAKDALLSREWTAQGDVVPVVDEYLYLGTLFTEKLCLKAMAKHRAAMAMKKFHAAKHVLSSHVIPADTRAMIFRSTILPTALYGAELWGMHQSRCIGGENLCKMAIKAIMGSHQVALGVARDQLGIPPFEAMAAARKARALMKFATLKTWVAKLITNGPSEDLTAHPAGSYPKHDPRNLSWVNQTVNWLRRRNWGVGNETLLSLVGQDPDGHQLYQLVLDRVWQRHRAKDKTKSLRLFNMRHLTKGAGWLRCWARWPKWHVGWKALLQMRNGAFLTVNRLRSMRLLHRVRSDGAVAGAGNSCPFCHIRGRGETLRHLLLDCGSWAKEREEFLGAILLDGEDMCPERQVSRLLGGPGPVNPMHHYDWIPDKPRKDNPVCVGSNNPSLSRFVAFRVAAFLSKVIPLRRRILRHRFPDKVEPKPAKGKASRHRSRLVLGRGRGDPSEVRVSTLEAVTAPRYAPPSALESLADPN